jgi:hypothetical protein
MLVFLFITFNILVSFSAENIQTGLNELENRTILIDRAVKHIFQNFTMFDKVSKVGAKIFTAFLLGEVNSYVIFDFNEHPSFLMSIDKKPSYSYKNTNFTSSDLIKNN